MDDLYYWLMDGRAQYDIDSALVLETCDTYQEAWDNRNDYGADTCIIQVSENDQVLMHCIMWEEVIDNGS